MNRLLPPPALVGPALLGLAVLILAAEPARWLIQTWTNPLYASYGGSVFLIVAALLGWSALSPLVAPNTSQRKAVGLLIFTAFLRLVGQVLAVDTIAALTLSIDVFAIALLLGTHRRQRSLSPFWLAVLFTFSLPLERIIQRLIGYKLQELSAGGACRILNGLFEEVSCEGIRITVEGADVLIDLPCSGARSLLLFLMGFTALAAIVRPKPLAAIVGAVFALGGAFAANLIRITSLSAGVALAEGGLKIDVMAQPWHDAIGLASLALTVPLLLFWASRVDRYAPQDGAQENVSDRLVPAGWRDVAVGAALVGVALLVVDAPKRPIDTPTVAASVTLPPRLGTFVGMPAPLSPKEDLYFRQYNGAAAKATYGPYALLMTQTASPLRHLHAPDECLRGLGFSVKPRGMRFSPLPTTTWRAVSPDGTVFRVETSFISTEGHRTSNVAEAIWLWMTHPGTSWTALQRVTPWEMEPSTRAYFEGALLAALELAPPPPTENSGPINQGV